jgi:hypothetical protein
MTIFFILDRFSWKSAFGYNETKMATDFEQRNYFYEDLEFSLPFARESYDYVDLNVALLLF